MWWLATAKRYNFLGQLLEDGYCSWCIQATLTMSDDMPYMKGHIMSVNQLWMPTDREYEVLQEMWNGWSNQQIANTLNIGIKTVETHIAHIYDKLGLEGASRNRVTALRVALNRGWIKL